MTETATSEAATSNTNAAPASTSQPVTTGAVTAPAQNNLAPKGNPPAREETTLLTEPVEETKETPPAETKETSEAKPTEEKKAEPKVEGQTVKTVPDKYELKPPEGSLLAKEHIESVAALAKELGLTNENAQKLLEKQSEALSAYEKAQENALAQEGVKWAEQVKNDPEIGGVHFKENVELAKRAVEKFASKDLRLALNATGLGNHPEMVRCFVKVGKLLANDKAVQGTRSSTSQKKSFAEVLYDNNAAKVQES